MKNIPLKFVFPLFSFFFAINLSNAQCSTDPLICDDFESYEVGTTISDQSSWWFQWGALGIPEDGLVSNDFAASGNNSLLVYEGQLQEFFLALSNRDTGQYSLRWKMYIPAGATGYYNIQEDENPGVAWNLEVFFNKENQGAGTGTVLGSAGTFQYPEDSWFDLVHVVDLDNDQLVLLVDGQIVEAAAYTGNLGSVNFFSIDEFNRYYIDDVGFDQLEPCVANTLICDHFETYATGSTIAGQNSWWTTWSNMPGGDDDAVVSSDFAASGINSLLIAEGMEEDILLLLDGVNSGQYQLNWKTYIPSDATGFYGFLDFDIEFPWLLDVFYNNEGQNPGTGEILQSGTTFGYPQDQWFDVEHFIDLDNDEITLSIDGDTIESLPYTGKLDAVNFFSIDSLNRYYIDDVGFMNMTTTSIQVHTGLSNNQYSVLPNPARDFAIIECNPNHFSPAWIRVYNMLGQLVFIEKIQNPGNHKIDVRLFPSGIYDLFISNESYAETIKLLVLKN